MKRSVVFALLAAMATCAIAANYAEPARYDPVMPGFNKHRLPVDASLSMAGSWTPPAYQATAAAHGWIELSDTDQYRIWVAFRSVRNQSAQIAVKVVTKGLNGAPTEIDVMGARVACVGNGAAPNYAQMVTMQEFASNHAPIGFEGPIQTMALSPGTNLAVAVKQVCKHLDMPARG